MALIKYCQLVQFPVIRLVRMSFSLLNFMVIRVKWHLPKDDLRSLQENSLPCPDTQHQIGVWGKKEAPAVYRPHLEGAVYSKQDLTTVAAVILPSKQINRDSFSTSQLSIYHPARGTLSFLSSYAPAPWTNESLGLALKLDQTPQYTFKPSVHRVPPRQIAILNGGKSLNQMRERGAVVSMQKRKKNLNFSQ